MTPASTRPDGDQPAPPAYPGRNESTDPTPPPPTGQPPTGQPPLRSPTPPASQRTVVLVVAAAISGNLALRDHIASVAGWLSVSLLALVVLSSPHRRTPTAVVAAGASVVVASNLVLRASDWVTSVTVVACMGLLGLAALDRLATLRVRGLIDDVVAAVHGAIDGPRHVLKPVLAPLAGGDGRGLALLRGTVVAGTVTLLLGLLLANADAAFGQLLDQPIGASAVDHTILTGILILVAAGVAATARRPAPEAAAAVTLAARPVEAIMGLAAVALTLAVWVATQATIALGGADLLLSEAGITRAEHAREGFFELVVVAGVVLSLIVGFGALLADRRSVSARGLIGAVGGLTVGLVAVTFSRLWLYIDAFGLTMLRLAVAWFLLWLALQIAAVCAKTAELGPSRPWLVPFAVLSAALVVAGFGWSNPEAVVASTNLERTEADLDLMYLATLGPDAASVLGEAGMGGLIDPCPERPYGPLSWNLGRARTC